MTDLEKAVKDLQDNLLVLTEIERRQSAMLREHSERIVANEEYIARLNAESAKYQRRTEQNLAEITDKLNGLIGYMDGQHRPPRE
jgi:23S rRNA maturation mini-RNase III